MRRQHYYAKFITLAVTAGLIIAGVAIANSPQTQTETTNCSSGYTSCTTSFTGTGY